MTKVSLVNPLTVKKQIEGQIVWFYNDAMYQECNVTEAALRRTISTPSSCRASKEDPPQINIAFFKTGIGWMAWVTTRHLGSNPVLPMPSSRSPEKR